MNYIIKILATFYWITCISKSSIAQRDTTGISKIRSYVVFIDSLSTHDDDQKFMIRSIAEGPIKQDIVVTKVGLNNKIDTLSRKQKRGGFSIYTYENINGDSLYKIRYHSSIDKNFYETYYYKDNLLVYAKIDYQEDGMGKTFYYREEYFQNREIILSHESTKNIIEPYKERISFDLRKKGYSYFENWEKNR